MTTRSKNQANGFAYIARAGMLYGVLGSIGICALTTASMVLAPVAFAEAVAPATHWYRYYNNGVPQTSKTITEAHIAKGYEELDAGFRLIRKVPPYSKADAEAKDAALEEKNKALEERQQLMKIYGTSARATRKRAQLLGDVSGKRAFAQQQLITANSQLQTELSKAAQLEKNQQTIPKDLKTIIDTRHAAVQAAKANLDSLMIQQLQEVKQISQDIRRLRKFEMELSGASTTN